MSNYFPVHSFKKHEWSDTTTMKVLVHSMEQFEKEFDVQYWNRSLIVHFLEVFNYLYPGGMKEHHIRCVATIINKQGCDNNGKVNGDN